MWTQWPYLSNLQRIGFTWKLRERQGKVSKICEERLEVLRRTIEGHQRPTKVGINDTPKNKRKKKGGERGGAELELSQKKVYNGSNLLRDGKMNAHRSCQILQQQQEVNKRLQQMPRSSSSTSLLPFRPRCAHTWTDIEQIFAYGPQLNLLRPWWSNMKSIRMKRGIKMKK